MKTVKTADRGPPIPASPRVAGADTEYLPFFTTADGGMPILYVKMPSIEEPQWP